MNPLTEPYWTVSRADLQNAAETVHLAIKLLEDSERETIVGDGVGTSHFLKTRITAIREYLKQAMMILTPYMPNYVKPEKEFAEQAREAEQASKASPNYMYLSPAEAQAITQAVLKPLEGPEKPHTWNEAGEIVPALQGDDSHPGDEIERHAANCGCEICQAGPISAEETHGFLDGGDEQSYSSRHA